jgi:hypothetical protein
MTLNTKVLSFASLLLLTAVPAFAKKPAPKPTPVKFESTFAASTGATATGTLKYRSEGKGSAKSAKVIHFRSRVDVPLPSTLPAIADGTAAASANLIEVFSRAGVPFAQCTLAFQAAEEEEGATTAHFRVDIQSNTKGTKVRLKAKKGSCDTDLVTEGVQSGLPAVQAGDTVSVQIVGADLVATEFLTGTL